jgi:hypothetical protein
MPALAKQAHTNGKKLPTELGDNPNLGAEFSCKQDKQTKQRKRYSFDN